MFSIRLICAAEPDVSPTYPPEVIVPRPTPLVDLERVAPFYRDSRFPVVTWRNRENGALLFRGAAAASRRYAYCTCTMTVCSRLLCTLEMDLFHHMNLMGTFKLLMTLHECPYNMQLQSLTTFKLYLCVLLQRRDR